MTRRQSNELCQEDQGCQCGQAPAPDHRRAVKPHWRATVQVIQRGAGIIHAEENGEESPEPNEHGINDDRRGGVRHDVDRVDHEARTDERGEPDG